jgi:peptidoglycan/LPS O-acetylase OafA/YrhL
MRGRYLVGGRRPFEGSTRRVASYRLARIQEGDSRHGVNPAFARRLVGIEGLRGLAAASVLMGHVWLTSQPNGQSFHLGWPDTYVFPQLKNGVTLFFVLSGFLLFLPFAAAVLREQRRPAFDAYIRNRALRILPAYWFILLCTALVLQTARVYQAGTLGVAQMDNLSLLGQNALLLQNYHPATVATGIGPAWSLEIEVLYYLLLPLLVLAAILLARMATTRGQRVVAMLFPAVLLGVVGVASVALGPNSGFPFARTWVGVWRLSFFTHAHLFAPGLALAVALVEYQDGRLRLPRWWRPVAGIAGVVVAVTAIKLTVDGTILARWEPAIIAIACSLLLALTVLSVSDSRSRLVATLDSRTLVAAGLASYSVYLWHYPVILWLRDHNLTISGGFGAYVLNLTVVAAAVGVLSGLTYNYVEKPALRFKARTHVAKREPPPAPRRSETAV